MGGVGLVTWESTEGTTAWIPVLSHFPIPQIPSLAGALTLWHQPGGKLNPFDSRPTLWNLGPAEESAALAAM